MGTNNAFSVVGPAIRDALSAPAFSDLLLVAFTLGVAFSLLSMSIRFVKTLCYGGRRRPCVQSDNNDSATLYTVEHVKCNIHGGICEGCPLSGTSSCYGVIAIQERMRKHGKT